MRMLAVAGCAAALGVAAPASAAPASFAGSTITINVAGTAGGLFDLMSRTLGEYYGRHLPGNPAIVVKDQPGGGGLVAGNYLYNVAPKDGTVLAYVGPIAMDPLLNPGSGRAKFDAQKFTWIGSLGTSHSVLVIWNGAPIKTAQDLFTKETIVAGTGAGATTDFYPKVLNDVLGTKFKLITGYQGSKETYLAIERGEAYGRFNSWDALKSTKSDWLEQKKVRIVLQAAFKRHPELPDVPNILDFAKTPQQKQTLRFMVAPSEMRPIAGPPAIPADRVKALRDGFTAAVKDPAYLAEAKKRGIDASQPMTGEDLASAIREIYRTPKPIVDRVAAAMH
ncbi:MAG TPA: tripartite tricarboxylate transporter substrate-binding protein [Alphaproteobacteria bacterium]|nr:tripartite tricarboxylate transporter substrate-binding protein [Alphaproteobacteria bacterium]